MSQLAFAHRKSVHLGKWYNHEFEMVKEFSHESYVRDLQWEPQKSRIGTVTMDGFLHIWDVDSEDHFELKGSSQREVPELYALAWHPTKPWIAVGGQEGIVQIWDIEEQQVLHSYNLEDQAIFSLAWRKQGDLLAASGEGSYLHVLNTDNIEEKPYKIVLEGLTFKVGWDYTGRHLAATDSRGFVLFWDSEIKMSHTHRLGEGASSLAWQTSHPVIAISYTDSNIGVWKTDKWAEIDEFTGPWRIPLSIDWDPEDRFLAICSQGYFGIADSEYKPHISEVFGKNFQGKVQVVAWQK